MNASIASKFYIQHPQVKLSEHCEYHNFLLRTLCVPKIKTSKPKANKCLILSQKFVTNK